MANYKTDNYTQLAYMGAQGNKSNVSRRFADISAINGNAGFANGDTFDIAKIPGGARVIEGFIYVGTVACATSTLAVGVKYADGTSTGGTTGTAVLVAGTASSITAAHTRYQFRFKPLTNDVDTIVYATWLSPGAPSGATGNEVDFSIDYVAEGTK